MPTIDQVPFENPMDNSMSRSASPTAKRIWQTPRLITLDLEETETGSYIKATEAPFYGPSGTM